MERTLIILKPDAVQRGLVGEIVSRFEKAGLKIIGMKMVHPGEEHYHHHYETISKMVTRYGKEVHERNVAFMMSGPVIAVVLEGIDAVQLIRKLVGDTDPQKAAPGSIRGDYAHTSRDYVNQKSTALPNIIHASGDKKEARQEIAHWFSKSDLFEYKTVHQKFTTL